MTYPFDLETRAQIDTILDKFIKKNTILLLVVSASVL